MTDPQSMLHEETRARWSALEDESAPCAVVSERMELMYLNEPARQLVPSEWFARRCWEVFPVAEEDCVWKCPTVFAVNTADSATYCEETLASTEGGGQTLGVAVVPLSANRPGRARAILVFCPKVFRPEAGGEAELEEGQAAFLERATALVERALEKIS